MLFNSYSTRALDRSNQARSAELVMTISYPASPIRIFVLLKILPNIVENLKKKKRERKVALEKTER